MSDIKNDKKPSALDGRITYASFPGGVRVGLGDIYTWSFRSGKDHGVSLRAAPEGMVIETPQSDEEDVIPWAHVRHYRRFKKVP